MGYQHTDKSEVVKLPLIYVYTSHFFQRYNQRCLHKDSLKFQEVAGFFFIRNPILIPIKVDEEVNRNFKKHGVLNTQGMRVMDGFCFTPSAIEGEESEDGIREHDKVDAMKIVYKTFLNESDMTESQRAAIDKKHLETLKRCWEALQMGIKNEREGNDLEQLQKIALNEIGLLFN